MSDSATVLVFMTGRNCADFLAASIGSVAAQSYPAVHLLFIDDGSTDQSFAQATALAQQALPGRSTVVRNDTPRGKAGNAATHLREHASQFTAVAVVDADDRLADPAVLGRVAAKYDRGFDVVWTTYATDDDRRGMNGPLNPFESPRGQGWKSSHLFTFRAELWNGVPDEYLRREDGEWFDSACDFAIAYPVLDQTRRYCYLDEVGYLYTVANPASHHNQDPRAVGLSSTGQQRNAMAVLSKQPLPCTRFPAEVPAVLHDLLAENLSRLAHAADIAIAETRRLGEVVARVPYTLAARARLVEDEEVAPARLDAVGGWSLDLELLDRIADTLALYERPQVLELGSGAGTVVLARLVANRGGRLTTVEHDPFWLARTTTALRDEGLDGTAQVLLCPLVASDTFGFQGRFYDLDAVRGPFQVAVLDGPPSTTNPLARFPALPAVAPMLDPSGFHVFLDDYERPDEQKTVEMWRTIAPDLVYEQLVFAKQAAVIRSSKSHPVPAAPIRAVVAR